MAHESCYCLMVSVADGEGIALAEHYAISRTPLARGLKVINTERATVPMRCVPCIS